MDNLKPLDESNLIDYMFVWHNGERYCYQFGDHPEIFTSPSHLTCFLGRLGVHYFSVNALKLELAALVFKMDKKLERKTYEQWI